MHTDIINCIRRPIMCSDFSIFSSVGLVKFLPRDTMDKCGHFCRPVAYL